MAITCIAGLATGLLLFEELNGSVIPTRLGDDPINSLEDFTAGTSLYENTMQNATAMAGWRMEGAGTVTFTGGWMKMESPGEAGHHVYWCPVDFPGSFIANWTVRNLEPDAGLLIVFFAAKGLGGEDIFDASLAARDGTFTGYTRGDIRNYHVSYYANGRDNPGRLAANLRKNKGFDLVQIGRDGIPIASIEPHVVTLVKNGSHIVMFIDKREIINWTDTGAYGGGPHADGKIGFRQMSWSSFLYCNFSVWELGS